MTKIIDGTFEPGFLEKLKYPTPYFLFSKKKVVSNYQKFNKLFPGCEINYAMKANSEPDILKILNVQGSSFEVASKYELDMLKKIKVPASRVIYGTSVKPADHIKEFYDYGVDRYACDSFSEIEKIATYAPGSKIYVRTIANDSGSVFKFSEKFGTDPSGIIPLLTKARELGLKPYGISFHVGSQASNPKAWAEVLMILRSILEDLMEIGIKLEVLNLGGGFPCQYTSVENIPTLEEIAKYTLKQYKKLPYQPQIVVEPGRGIIADTAVAVASVIARVDRRGSTWLFLDLGVYNGLFETMAYQGSTRYPVINVRRVGNEGETLFGIAGPTGDSPDVISREALLSGNTEVGDKLVFYHVGAYGLPTVSPFNGFPKPEVYYV